MHHIILAIFILGMISCKSQPVITMNEDQESIAYLQHFNPRIFNKNTSSAIQAVSDGVNMMKFGRFENEDLKATKIIF